MSDDPYKHSGVAERLAHAAGLERGGANADRVNIALTKQLHRSMTLNARIKNGVKVIIADLDKYIDVNPVDGKQVATKLRTALKSADEATGLPPELFEVMIEAARLAYEDAIDRWKLTTRPFAKTAEERSRACVVDYGPAEGRHDRTKIDMSKAREFDNRKDARFHIEDRALRDALEAAFKAMAA